MVHQKLLSEGKVQPLTYKELARIERIDAKKAKTEKQLEVAKEAVSQVGNLGSSALTALAALATGPGGYVLSLAAIHLLEKVIRVNTPLDLYDVTFQSVIVQGTGIIGGGSIPTQGLGVIGQPLGTVTGGFETTVLGPVQHETMSLADLNAARNDPSIHIINAVPISNLEGLLSTDEAELAKALLATAAGSGVAGSLLGGLFGRK